MRTLIAIPLVVLALAIPAAAPALAGSGHSARDGVSAAKQSDTQQSTVNHSGGAKSAVKHSAGKQSSKKLGPQPKPKPVRFSTSGSVTAIDATAGTVSFVGRGGQQKSVRTARNSAPVTVTVTAETTIKRNQIASTIGDLVVGDTVRVSGVRTGTTWTAHRISAHSARSDVVTPTPTPTVTPTPTPTPTPTV